MTGMNQKQEISERKCIMTSAEIRGSIRYHEGLVSSYQNSVRQLENQINELLRLKGKFQNLQSNFGSRQSNRKNKLAGLFSTTLKVKMISNYRSGMNQLLTGSEYSNSYNGLSAAQERINTKIRSIQKEINAYNDKIVHTRGRIAYFRNQLAHAQD